MITNEIDKPDNATLVVRRILKAPPELVFRAWTTPEHIVQWMRPEPGMEVSRASMDLRVGGKFRIQMKMPDGEYFTAVGEFQEVTSPTRLVYTWDWEKDGAGEEFGEVEGKTTLITVDFHERAGRTELVLTHTRFATVESRDSHAQGWDKLVESFTNFVDNNLSEMS